MPAADIEAVFVRRQYARAEGIEIAFDDLCWQCAGQGDWLNSYLFAPRRERCPACGGRGAVIHLELRPT